MKTEEIILKQKKRDDKLPSVEVGKVTSIEPFKIQINGQEYSSENFTIYVPLVDRIMQHKIIDVVDHTKAIVEIGDLELEPGDYARLFKIGDLISVTDRGDSFIVHQRLIKVGG